MLPLARAAAVFQSAEQSQAGEESGDMVGVGRARAQRGATGIGGEVGQPGEGLDGGAEASVVFAGAGAAHRRQAEHYYVSFELLEVGVVKAPVGHDAGGEVFDDGVAKAHQLLSQSYAIGAIKVQGDSPLVAVPGVVVAAGEGIFFRGEEGLIFM